MGIHPTEPRPGTIKSGTLITTTLTTMNAEQKVADLKAEIARIQAKRSASSDKDIIEALQFKEEALADQLKVALQELEEAKDLEAAEAAPEVELSPEEVQKDIRLARAHLAGDRRPAAREILTRLEKTAPNNVDVLELKADMLLLNKDVTNALPVLKKARKLAPKDVSIEKKLAEVAMRASTVGTFDDQMRGGDSLLMISQSDMKASATAATVCSVILPGLGHLVVGMTTKGIVYLSIWLITMVPFSILVGNQLNAIHGNIHNFNPSMTIIGLGFVGAMCYFVALFECAALGKSGGGGGKRPPIDRPKPPVDLPFE